MPIYCYECQVCRTRQDGYRSIAEREDSPDCCGQRTKLVIVPAHIAPDITEYVSPVTRKVVRGRKMQREDLASTGCRLADPSEKKQFTTPRKDRDVNWRL